MKALARGIKADEASADHFAGLATLLREDDSASSVAIANLGRLHRVRVIELQAKLGALIEQWGALHLDGGR